ncbi:MAG: hypothetical protein JSS79_00725 [Bacteroidetes bacterium]|nr:hypothetical protein [Bacteroidota bacterium]
MKSFCFLLLVSVVLIQCATKKSSEAPEAAQFTSAVYNDSLYSKAITLGSAARGLDLFKNYFSTQPDSVCDQDLKEYIAYSFVVADSISRQLSRRSDIDKLTSAYFDPKGNDDSAKKFESELNQNALQLESSEGSLFVSPDPDKIAQAFNQHLSPITKEYLAQWVIEEKQPWGADAGFIISVMDMAKRAAFWDAFVEKNPRHIFIDKARANKLMYLSYLMVGLDNTPAFGDNLELSPEFLDAFTYLSKTYPTQECGKVMTAYVQLLKDNNNRRTPAVDEFIKKYGM